MYLPEGLERKKTLLILWALLMKSEKLITKSLENGFTLMALILNHLLKNRKKQKFKFLVTHLSLKGVFFSAIIII